MSQIQREVQEKVNTRAAQIQDIREKYQHAMLQKQRSEARLELAQERYNATVKEIEELGYTAEELPGVLTTLLTEIDNIIHYTRDKLPKNLR